MSIKNKFFILFKTIWGEKVRTVITVVSMAIVLALVILPLELLKFISYVGDDFEVKNVDCRCMTMTVTDDMDASDIISLYKQDSTAAMVIRRSRYNTGVLYKGEDVDCLLNLKASSPSSVPKVTSGKSLDFSVKDQVILPQNMILYGSDGVEREIDAKKLVGKQITCSLQTIDYAGTFVIAEDDLIYSGRPKKDKLITLTVVGTYDNKFYYEKSHTAFVSADTADSYHFSDIEDPSGQNMYSSVVVMAGSRDGISDIRSIADENGIESRMLSSYDFKTYLISRVAAYFFIFIMLVICIRVANSSIKSDLQDNIADYVMLGTFGYSNDSVRGMLTCKYILLYIISSVLAIIISMPLSGGISDLLYKLDGNVYDLDFYMGSVIWILVISIVVAIFTIVSLSMSVFSCTVRDVVKD